MLFPIRALFAYVYHPYQHVYTYVYRFFFLRRQFPTPTKDSWHVLPSFYQWWARAINDAQLENAGFIIIQRRPTTFNPVTGYGLIFLFRCCPPRHRLSLPKNFNKQERGRPEKEIIHIFAVVVGEGSTKAIRRRHRSTVSQIRLTWSRNHIGRWRYCLTSMVARVATVYNFFGALLSAPN